MQHYRFNGRRILITGASGGVGSALVQKLAQTACRMVISSRSEKALEELIGRLSGPAEVFPVTADLARPGQAQRLAEQSVQILGGVDLLFNIAGIGYFALMQEASEEKIRHLFEVNTLSPLFLIKTLLPQMKARGGSRIVNIVSCAGRVPIPSVGVYGGSKSALAIMTNTMRLELAPHKIDILNLYLGTTATAFEENALREEDRRGLCPTERCGTPRFDVARQILKAAAGPPGEIFLEPQGKWLSVASLIWPGFVDRQLSALRDKVVRKKPLQPRPWRLLQVETTLACNLRCVMCPWREIARNAPDHGIMRPEVWAAIRPFLPQVQAVDFTGGGEPLIQPHLVTWVSEAHAAGCETGILTNGVLLTPERTEALIDAGIDWICVSLDGATADTYEQIRKGASFERVCANLQAVAMIRKGKVPKLMINFVLMTINFHQVREIVRLAARLGVDQVNFKQCAVIRGNEGKGFQLFAAQETRQVRRLQKDLSRALSLAKKLGIQTASFPFTPQEKPVCDQDPRNSMFIRHDGAVAPCINLAQGGPTLFLGRQVVMPTVLYGRLPQQDLQTLWESETCRFYRERFQNRAITFEKELLDNFIGSGASREQAEKQARVAMPAAPSGCSICHYLYNL